MPLTMKNIRATAAYWNARRERFEKRRKDHESMCGCDTCCAWDEARKNAWYWNQVVNNENGYI